MCRQKQPNNLIIINGRNIMAPEAEDAAKEGRTKIEHDIGIYWTIEKYNYVIYSPFYIHRVYIDFYI